MRELTKAMLSFSWAMPLYGMRQMLNLSMPTDASRPLGKGTDSFAAVTDTMRGEMGPTMQGMFDAGDRIQRGMVDLMFSFVSPQAWDPSSWMKMTSDVMQSSMQGVGRVAQGAAAATSASGSGGGPAAGAGSQPSGWGPIPSPKR